MFTRQATEILPFSDFDCCIKYFEMRRKYIFDRKQ